VATVAVLRGALLRGIVEAARAALDARASSIALVDPRTGDLVFEAVAGGGGPELLGAHFRADQGIAGHVVQSGELLVIDDLARDPRWASDIAVEAGYHPEALSAAPISVGGTVVGVLSVLDAGEPPAGGTEAVLQALCVHAAVALALSDTLGDG
jgi:GAF domain-containing protein